MKIGICHTKIGLDADVVYQAWDVGVRNFGDIPYHCFSQTDVLRYDPDVFVCISYPQYNNLIQRLIPEFADMIKDGANIYRPNPINAFRTDIIKYANDHNKRMIFIDTGLLKCDRKRDGNKNNYYQVGFDCIKGLGQYYNDNMPQDRLSKLDIQIKPWRETNNRVLIFGQLRFGIGSQHIDIHAWYRFCMRSLMEQNYRIFYLEHPNVAEPFSHHRLKFKVVEDRNSRYEDMGISITFSSNACIDAIINGVPSIAMSQLSPAYEVCSNSLKEIKNIKLFDRKQWLADLSYTQWQINEMETGECWNHLRPHAMKLPSAQYPLVQKNTLP